MTMEGIVEKAKELGRLVAQTSEYQALRQANRRLAEDEEARTLVQTLSQSHEKVLGHLERGEQPPEDVRKSYEEAFEKAQAHPAYQGLIAAQANFDKVMERINEEMAKGVETGDKSRIIIPH